jgi:ribulose-5-phosphate 4-epimerase/fuculose-1-phosphate aldolase
MVETAAQPFDLSTCSPQEWRIRVDLAALYRLFDHHGWTDLTFTHLTARVPDEPEHYLISPFGLLFGEVTASSLLKVDFAGRGVSGAERYNQAGHLIHTALLRARPELNFILHSHTRAGVAVSAMQCGLLPISEHANSILGTLAYHNYDVADAQECERLARDLEGNYLMILHNHGLIACGRTAAESFLYHYFIQMACEVQVLALQSGQPWIPTNNQAVRALSAWGAPRLKPWGAKQWEASMRLLERKDPSFRS